MAAGRRRKLQSADDPGVSVSRAQHVEHRPAPCTCSQRTSPHWLTSGRESAGWDRRATRPANERGLSSSGRGLPKQGIICSPRQRAPGSRSRARSGPCDPVLPVSRRRNRLSDKSPTNLGGEFGLQHRLIGRDETHVEVTSLCLAANREDGDEAAHRGRSQEPGAGATRANLRMSGRSRQQQISRGNPLASCQAAPRLFMVHHACIDLQGNPQHPSDDDRRLPDLASGCWVHRASCGLQNCVRRADGIVSQPRCSCGMCCLDHSAARSPMIAQGAWVLPVVTRGMIEPSATRRPSMP